MSTSGTAGTAKQTLTWSLSGLDTTCGPNAAGGVSNGCGIHIHSGTSCASADEVGGHYYSAALVTDPWKPIVYVTRNHGRSTESAGVEVVTGLSAGDITGRVIVVHALDGARIACGVLGRETGSSIAAHVPSFVAYPGYSGIHKVVGTASITSISGTEATAKQLLKWSLAGADAACRTPGAASGVKNGCGIHVHAGTSCDSHAAVSGHYYSPALATDPWLPIAYVASVGGASNQESGVVVTTGLSTADVVGRVMVVHELASGRRIACGVIVDGGKSSTSDASSAVHLGMALPYLLMALGVRGFLW